MHEFISRALQISRYIIAGVGAVISLVFIGYGIYLRESGEETGLVDDFIIAFGTFVALQSCIIAALSTAGDKQVRRLVSAMVAQSERLEAANQGLEARVTDLRQLQGQLEDNTRALRDQIARAEERHRQRIEEFRAQTTALKTTAQNLRVENERLHESNQALDDTCERFQHLRGEYEGELDKLRAAHEDVVAEVSQLRIIAGDERLKVEQLEELAGEQRERIAEMTTQLENLNELQRKSVRMIQMLTLYGDDCKTLGTGLKDITSELRATDQSLGLTSSEMAVQLSALQAVTQQLRHVAASRGVNEDDIDDDAPLTDYYSAVSTTASSSSLSSRSGDDAV